MEKMASLGIPLLSNDFIIFTAWYTTFSELREIVSHLPESPASSSVF
jgi:hypothetical protein